jgi:hypothetical protein
VNYHRDSPSRFVIIIKPSIWKMKSEKSFKKENPAKEEPEIYAIHKDKNGYSMTRKDFLGSLAALSAGLVASASCATAFNTKSTRVNNMEVRKMEPETVTMPCGTPLPADAKCICNCVASSRTYPGTGMTCTCNTITVDAGTQLKNNWICTCNTVRSCSCDTVCTCDKVCSCNNNVSYYTYYTTYWHPN